MSLDTLAEMLNISSRLYSITPILSVRWVRMVEAANPQFCLTEHEKRRFIVRGQVDLAVVDIVVEPCSDAGENHGRTSQHPHTRDRGGYG